MIKHKHMPSYKEHNETIEVKEGYFVCPFGTLMHSYVYIQEDYCSDCGCKYRTEENIDIDIYRAIEKHVRNEIKTKLDKEFKDL